MATTNAHRLAVETDLNTVAGLKVYPDKRTMGFGEGKTWAEITDGAGGFGDSDQTGITNISGEVESSIEVLLTSQDSVAPFATMSNLLDLVRNALEKDAGTLLSGTGKVLWVAVDWDASEPVEGVDAPGWLQRKIQIRFAYHYRRGSL